MSRTEENRVRSNIDPMLAVNQREARAMEERAPRVRKSRKQRGFLRREIVDKGTEAAFRQLDLELAQSGLEQTFPNGLQPPPEELTPRRDMMPPIVHGKFARVREMMSAIARRLGF